MKKSRIPYQGRKQVQNSSAKIGVTRLLFSALVPVASIAIAAPVAHQVASIPYEGSLLQEADIMDGVHVDSKRLWPLLYDVGNLLKTPDWQIMLRKMTQPKAADAPRPPADSDGYGRHRILPKNPKLTPEVPNNPSQIPPHTVRTAPSQPYTGYYSEPETVRAFSPEETEKRAAIAAGKRPIGEHERQGTLNDMDFQASGMRDFEEKYRSEVPRERPRTGGISINEPRSEHSDLDDLTFKVHPDDPIKGQTARMDNTPHSEKPDPEDITVKVHAGDPPKGRTAGPSNVPHSEMPDPEDITVRVHAGDPPKGRTADTSPETGGFTPRPAAQAAQTPTSTGGTTGGTAQNDAHEPALAGNTRQNQAGASPSTSGNEGQKSGSGASNGEEPTKGAAGTRTSDQKDKNKDQDKEDPSKLATIGGGVVFGGAGSYLLGIWPNGNSAATNPAAPPVTAAAA